MKTMTAVLAMIVAFLFTLTPVSAFAEDLDLSVKKFKETEFTRLDAVKDLTLKTGGFVAGMAAGFTFHELGHQALAATSSVPMTWDGFGPNMTWTAHTRDRGRLAWVASGGFIAQAISTEVILGVDSIPKDNPFVLGWLTFNIVNSVSYVISHEMDRGERCSDLATLRHAGVNMPLVEGALVGHALLSAYRLATNKDLPIFIGSTGKDVSVLFTGHF